MQQEGLGNKANALNMPGEVHQTAAHVAVLRDREKCVLIQTLVIGYTEKVKLFPYNISIKLLYCKRRNLNIYHLTSHTSLYVYK